MSPFDGEELGRMDHLTEQEISRYLHRSVTDTERPLIEAHLAECAVCRHEAVGAVRLLQSKPRVRTWYAAAAAAAAIGFVLLIPDRAPQGPNPPTLRDGGSAEGVARIEPVAPLNDAAAKGRAIRFTWHPAAGGESYRVMVLTESGDSVWAGRTSDTTLSILLGERLRPGARYFWYVDGLLRDGRSATSGSIPFSIPP